MGTGDDVYLAGISEPPVPPQLAGRPSRAGLTPPCRRVCLRNRCSQCSPSLTGSVRGAPLPGLRWPRRSEHRLHGCLRGRALVVGSHAARVRVRHDGGLHCSGHAGVVVVAVDDGHHLHRWDSRVREGEAKGNPHRAPFGTFFPACLSRRRAFMAGNCKGGSEPNYDIAASSTTSATSVATNMANSSFIVVFGKTLGSL